MPNKRAQKLIDAAVKKVNAEIHAFSRDGNKFAAGLASEGYAGGYRDALNDVTLVLNGVTPHRRDYWDALTKRGEAL